MNRRYIFPAAVTALAVSIVFFLACAINPATGRHQLSLVGEGQEVSLGRDYDKQMTSEFGLYEDPALAQYVSGIGVRLAAKSERPNLPWAFRVVDDPIVNAFALPGGFIYVTRGILAHFNSEAELAAVLGHEIGHVTARHSVNQMSKAQLAQLGLGLGSILAPERAEQFGGLASAGLGLLFLKYGRDDERQADDLGLRYSVASGYDPRPMTAVFRTLGRVSAAQGAGRMPAWMSTHPAPEQREERIQQRITALGQDFSRSTVGEADYLQRIDGIIFGEDPRQGYFKGTAFFHPQMRFRLEFPADWKTSNRRQSVGAVSQAQDAAIQLTLAAEANAQAALTKFFSEEGISRTRNFQASLGGLAHAGAHFRAVLQEGALVGTVLCVEHEGRVFRLIGYSPEAKWASYDDMVARALASFSRLTDAKAINVMPARLKLVQASEGTTLAALAQRNNASVPTETLAILNQVETGSRLVAGRNYKVVVGGVQP